MINVSDEVKRFVENYINTVLEARKVDLRAQLDAQKDNQMRVILTQKLIEVIEIAISLRDSLHPTRIANNDHEDDAN